MKAEGGIRRRAMRQTRAALHEYTERIAGLAKQAYGLYWTIGTFVSTCACGALPARCDECRAALEVTRQFDEMVGQLGLDQGERKAQMEVTVVPSE